MRAATLPPLQRRLDDEPRHHQHVPQLKVLRSLRCGPGCPIILALPEVQDPRGQQQPRAVARDAHVAPHQVPQVLLPPLRHGGAHHGPVRQPGARVAVALVRRLILRRVAQRRLHQPTGEHQRVQQRVARQPVGAVDRRAGRLAAGVQAVDVGPSPRVDSDAAHHVMRRRRHRYGLPGDVQPVPPALGVDRWEAAGHRGGGQVRYVQHRRPAVGPLHLRRDGPRHHVPGRQVSHGVMGRHERVSVRVAQYRPLAAHRLRQQEGGRALQP